MAKAAKAAVNDIDQEQLFDDLDGSKYLAASDLHGETPHYKIGRVDVVELTDKNGTTKRKFVIHFVGVEKPMVVNKTNAKKLASAFGKDRSLWKGMSAELYSETTSFGEGLRLRPLKPGATAAPDLNDEVSI